MDVAAQVMALRRGEDEAGSALVERYRPFVLGRLKAAARARNWFWIDDIEDAAGLSGTHHACIEFRKNVRMPLKGLRERTSAPDSRKH